MSEKSDTKDEAGSRQSERYESDRQEEPGQRKRRSWRAVLIALGALLALVIAAAAGGYAYFNHAVSSIPRLHVAHLVPPAKSSLNGQTFLVTAYPDGPTGTAAEKAAQSRYSNLVVLLHTNADGKGGGAVTIPADVMVNVPGAGTEQLWDAMQKSGPSLLVQTITQLTGIPINHYARLDFDHIAGLVNAIGGIDVTVPVATKGFGYTFVKGINHLNGVTAVYYSRDPSLKGQDRVLRQENLMRVVMTKIANGHLLINPVTDVHVLNSITSLLSVDSNFTNSDIESLAGQFGKLRADAATFVTAPTRTVHGQPTPSVALDDQLWTAVKHDSIAAFAKKYPSTVAPQAAP